MTRETREISDNHENSASTSNVEQHHRQSDYPTFCTLAHFHLEKINDTQERMN